MSSLNPRAPAAGGESEARSRQREILENKLSKAFCDVYLSGVDFLDVGLPSGRKPSVAQSEQPDADAARLASEAPPEGDETQDVVLADRQLQLAANYRSAIQEWFRVLKRGGFLVVLVPHHFLYEKKASLPSQWNAAHQRFYTPASLMGEFEEALIPNSYRLRYLADVDRGYDYRRDDTAEPEASGEIACVIEKIEPPPWDLGFKISGPENIALPTQAPKIRVESTLTPKSHRIVVLKLDHLGDFVMGMPALKKLRKQFPAADIDLVCGAWNISSARQSGLFDQVLEFNATSSNPTEHAREPYRLLAERFRKAVGGKYDIAIDLRVDSDTRPFLALVDAGIKAGIGTQSLFPYLDVFLPVNESRHAKQTAQKTIPAEMFNSPPTATVRRGYSIDIKSQSRFQRRKGALIWGPYFELEPGLYQFEPHFERLGFGLPVNVPYDIALDLEVVDRGNLRIDQKKSNILTFRNSQAGAKFEFRIWPRKGGNPAVRFFGARFGRQGIEVVDALHQSEYLSLLVDLLITRVERTGILSKRIS